MRLVAAAVVVISSILFALWLGESGRSPLDIELLLLGLSASVAVALLAMLKTWKRVGLAIAFLAAYGASYGVGAASFSSAFAECLRNGEEIRSRLQMFRDRNGAYPERLEQISGAMPCPLIARATLLSYERSGSGYTLRFGDWLVEHKATESESFMAHK
jgi:hypothetical protein